MEILILQRQQTALIVSASNTRTATATPRNALKCLEDSLCVWPLPGAQSRQYVRHTPSDSAPKLCYRVPSS